MNSTWWYEYVLRLRRDATVYLKYKKIVIWQIKVFFKFLGVIKINFILLVQPSILQPYILQNISFPRIFSLKKGATLCVFCCWMKSSMRRRRILMMRHSRNISPSAKNTAHRGTNVTLPPLRFQMFLNSECYLVKDRCRSSLNLTLRFLFQMIQ